MPSKARKNSQPLYVDPSINPSASNISFPPAPSPSSSSFTSFLNKAAPKKWFTRSATPRSFSTNNAHTQSFGSLAEPRDSTSSRKPKISGPSDPRPILPNPNSNPMPKMGQSTGASSSVLDVTLKSSPPSMTPGDLRTIYKKGYSRSCDDLSRVTEGQPPIGTPTKRLDTHERIQMYRQGSYASSVSVNTTPTMTPATDTASMKNYPLPPSAPPPVPPLSQASHSHGLPPFPRSRTPPSSPGAQSLNQSFPRSGTVPTISVSTVHVHGTLPGMGMEYSPHQQHPPYQHQQQHGRSRSTNLLGALGGGPSAHRKGSFERDHTRSTSPFAESGLKHASSLQEISRASLDSPKEAMPGQVEEENKRSSQIIHMQGFINRLPSFSAPPLSLSANRRLPSSSLASPSSSSANTSSTHLPPVTSPHSLPKGWKPFKLVLRGNKLYFYKPPHSGIANGIKELFPTQLGDIMEEAGLMVSNPNAEAPMPVPKDFGLNEEIMKSSGGGGGLARRKRVYWGRGVHPELTVQNGRVIKGTPEGLAHEMVFGTTFGDSDENWRKFAHVVLLILPLPHAYGMEKFKTEYERCKGYYLSGLEGGSQEEAVKDENDAAKTKAKERMKWLDEEYARIWDDQKFEQKLDLPSPPASPGPSSPSRGFRPRSSSINALTEKPSYRKDSGPPSPPPHSPHGGMGGSTLPSFASSLAPPPGMGLEPSHHPSPTLDLNTEVLIRMESGMIAGCLADMHGRDVRGLKRAKEGELVRALLALPEIGSGNDTGLVLGNQNLLANSFAEMMGNFENPHWLAVFVIQSILKLSPSTSTLSKTHIRATLMAKWIGIAGLARMRGDEATFRGIAQALTSRCLARLEKSWRRMDDSVEDQVRSWVKDNKSVASQSFWLEGSPRSIAEVLGPEQLGQGMLDIDVLLLACDLLQRCFESIHKCQIRADSLLSEEAQQLINTFESARGSVLPKNVNLDSFLPDSLAAEPRSRSRYASHFWTRTTAPSPQGLIPLLFPESLPTACLLDRTQLYRVKKDSLEASASSLEVINEARMRAVIKSKGDGEANKSSSSTQGVNEGSFSSLNLPSPSISLYDGDLLLTADLTARPPSVHTPRTPNNHLTITSRPTSLVSASTRPVSGASEYESGESSRLSRAPSLRVTSRSASALERKVSLVRRSSLPSISQRASLVIPENVESNETPLLISVHAGSLDCLVDVLVLGIVGVSVSFADDHGEMPLHGRSRRLHLDKEDFDSTWWNVFRSFVTPLVFFELLRKRYIAADSKRASLIQRNGPPINEIDVVRTLIAWITTGGGMQDILDDQELDSILRSFIKDSINQVQGRPDSPLLESLKQLDKIVVEGSQRPKLDRQAWVERVPTAQNLRFGSDVPNPDSISPQDLVDCLNAIVAPGAPLEDFLVASDMLEVQTLDKLGWLPGREPPVHYEEVEIQSLLSVMQTTPPSSLLNDIEQETFYKALPPSIRSFIRSHAVISKWALAAIIEPGIGGRRERRMNLLLSAIEICRPRPNPLAPCARTFVEAALTSAILSRESRLFHRAWHNVAAARGSAIDSLSGFLSNSPTTSRGKDLRTDVGWILERMLEVGSLPDTFDSSQGGMSLVNFTKRRYLCGLVRSTPAKLQQTDYDRLNNMYSQVSKLEFDFRMVQMDAHRENGQWMQTQRRAARPFQSLVMAQMEKHRRDKHLRERLLRERKAEQQRREQRENDINRAMNPKKPIPLPSKPTKSRRTVSSAFFRVMRPISTAFSSENIHSSTQRLTAAELDFQPNSKPSWVINLADAKIAIFNNPERPNTFQVDTEDGDQYLLQAPSRADMNKWINSISNIARSSASKRLTYTTSLHPKMEDHLTSRGPTSSRHPVAMFGVSLPFLLKREAGSDEIPLGAIPSVITKCLGEIEKRGLQEVGIYRIAGQSSVTTSLRNAFDRDEFVDLSSDKYLDINSICDTVKSYFRMLPEPLFPEYSYWEVIRVMQTIDFEQRFANIRKLVGSLPPSNYTLLKRLMEHLERVTDFEEHNHMTAAALAIVFAPNLVRAPGNDFGLTMGNMNHTTGLVKTLITHFHSIFEETEAEAEEEEEMEEALDPIDESSTAIEVPVSDEAAVVGELDVGQPEKTSEGEPLATTGHDAIHDHDSDFEGRSPAREGE